MKQYLKQVACMALAASLLSTSTMASSTIRFNMKKSGTSLQYNYYCDGTVTGEDEGSEYLYFFPSEALLDATRKNFAYAGFAGTSGSVNIQYSMGVTCYGQVSADEAILTAEVGDVTSTMNCTGQLDGYNNITTTQDAPAAPSADEFIACFTGSASDCQIAEGGVGITANFSASTSCPEIEAEGGPHYVFNADVSRSATLSVTIAGSVGEGSAFGTHLSDMKDNGYDYGACYGAVSESLKGGEATTVSGAMAIHADVCYPWESES